METTNPTEEDKSTLKEGNPNLEKDLVTWIAPARPFKKRDRKFYLTIISIVALVSLIIFLAEGAMPVVLIISLVFLYYVMSTVQPENISYKITNKGVNIAGKLTTWENFGRFWFTKRHDSELLIFEIFKVPGRLELVIDSNFKEQIEKILSKYLNEEEIPPSTLDKAIAWFGKKLPN